MFAFIQMEESDYGRGVEVPLPREVAHDELESAINRVLARQYAREIWAKKCRVELDDVTNDNHQTAGRRYVSGYTVPSCMEGFTLHVDMRSSGQLLEPPRSLSRVNIGRTDMGRAMYGLCCARHQLGRPPLRSCTVEAADAAAWFIDQLRVALQ